MKYSLLSMATFSMVSKKGFSSSSTSSVLTLMASIATLNESERKRKCILKCTSFRQFLLCLLLLTLGCAGQWTTGPHLVHMSMWVCDDLFSSQDCSCPRLGQSRLHFCSKISHSSISCFVSVYIYPFLCPPPALFLSTLSGLYIHVCLRHKLLPPSFIFFLSIPLSIACLIETFTNALQILKSNKSLTVDRPPVGDTVNCSTLTSNVS